MGFALTEQQELLRASVHDWGEAECPKGRALALDAVDEYPFAPYDAMAKAGFHAVGLPRSF